ncbi:MAG: hypothetical protein RSE13_13475 [Planktothrix sp. GU0601_MAG3]|nr:MAG: hypothetical protein RSE13_13475 [Planktothrix sp. GU0601_MAG3]
MQYSHLIYIYKPNLIQTLPKNLYRLYQILIISGISNIGDRTLISYQDLVRFLSQLCHP